MGCPDMIITIDGLPAIVEVKTDKKLLRSPQPHRAGVQKAIGEYFSQGPAYVLVIPNDDYSSQKDRQRASYLLRNGAKIVHLPISRQEFRSYIESMISGN